MVLPSPQARVCSGSQSLEASSSVAQLETKIALREEALRQRQLIGVATGLLARPFSISREREGTLAADNADDESGVANSESRIH
jgi:hypothetical protein